MNARQLLAAMREIRASIEAGTRPLAATPRHVSAAGRRIIKRITYAVPITLVWYCSRIPMGYSPTWVDRMVASQRRHARVPRLPRPRAHLIEARWHDACQLDRPNCGPKAEGPCAELGHQDWRNKAKPDGRNKARRAALRRPPWGSPPSACPSSSPPPRPA